MLANGDDRWQLVLASRLYQTPPWGKTDQPDFINAVAALDTDLSARELLAGLQCIEHAHGRRRSGPRWGPRTLDIDLLLFGQEIMDCDELTLPHPRLHERAFVLLPLAELAPELEIPGKGPVATLLRVIDCSGCRLAKRR